MLEACPWNTVGLSMDFPRVAVNAGPARVFVKQWLDSPLAFFMKTESTDRDATWLQALPSEALRLFMKHVLELQQGQFQAEIKGALTQTMAPQRM